ncbi:hypothetical protein [Gemmata sp. SH-PL17]|uniref:hypothetical protein n=1 Tax=Gemmata sp. SH-PL17 TaxID=1630693 RepID=UPI0012F7C153|nr:hypothetical protein [Gemmata sp. SH-PL17]
MTKIVTTKLTGLAGTMAELKERVRIAVAGELGRAVGDAVRQVVQAVVAERPEPPAARRPPASRWDDEDEDDRDGWDRPRDPWGETGRDRNDDDDDYDRSRGSRRATPTRHEPPIAEPSAVSASMTAAVAAGVYVARWWLVRRGTLLAAAGPASAAASRVPSAGRSPAPPSPFWPLPQTC